MESGEADRVRMLKDMRASRWLAHQFLFGHRHQDDTPPFHLRLIDEWHDTQARAIDLCFRGSAKSTLSEEAFIIRALFEEMHNGLVLGDSIDRAVERLEVITYELEYNERIHLLFGQQKGSVWQARKIILANGVCIQAVGSGMSLRGIKHRSWRPDCVLVDDVEGDENVSTPDQRAKTRKWFTGVVLPALTPTAHIRIMATPLDAESLPLQLRKSPDWRVTEIPIKFIDPDTGQWVSSWPGRYPLDWIDKTEELYRKIGSLAEFKREYMVEAVTDSERVFRPEFFKTEHLVRKHEAVYAMYDPARTANKQTSCMTGVSVWSWVRDRLVVWKSGGYFWQPSEIIESIFDVANEFQPVAIGVEQDGLEEFILQPLRVHQLQRGTCLPIRGCKAPRGKLEFIKGLQPFFKAGEVIFVGEGHEQLREQLENFPRGLIDIPNALAYALILRPGQPVYPEFREEHIVHGMKITNGEPVWCVLHGDAYTTVLVAMQFVGRRVHVLYDAVAEGPPGEAVRRLVQTASLEIGRGARWLAPPSHFRQFDTIGLRPAATTAGAAVRQGGDITKGREELRTLLRAEDGFRIGARAKWAIRSLMGGFATETEPTDAYALCAGALETFAARLAPMRDEQEQTPNMKTTPDGRRYYSSRV